MGISEPPVEAAYSSVPNRAMETAQQSAAPVHFLILNFMNFLQNLVPLASTCSPRLQGTSTPFGVLAFPMQSACQSAIAWVTQWESLNALKLRVASRLFQLSGRNPAERHNRFWAMLVRTGAYRI
jgi:hypothetical protein